MKYLHRSLAEVSDQVLELCADTSRCLARYVIVQRSRYNDLERQEKSLDRCCRLQKDLEMTFGGDRARRSQLATARAIVDLFHTHHLNKEATRDGELLRDEYADLAFLMGENMMRLYALDELIRSGKETAEVVETEGVAHLRSHMEEQRELTDKLHESMQQPSWLEVERQRERFRELNNERLAAADESVSQEMLAYMQAKDHSQD